MLKAYTLLLLIAYYIVIGLCEYFHLEFLEFCLKMLHQYPDVIRLCLFDAKLHIFYILSILKELFE